MGNNKDRLNQRFSQAQNSKSSSVSSVNDGSNSSRLTNYVANKRNEERASAKTKTDDYRTYGYKTQEAYDADVKKYSWANANKGLTYDEVKSRKQTATGDELNYLNQYGTLVGYNNLEDYDKEIADINTAPWYINKATQLSVNASNKVKSILGMEQDTATAENVNKAVDIKAYKDELENKRNLYEVYHSFDKYSDIANNEDFEENTYFDGEGKKLASLSYDTAQFGVLERALSEGFENIWGKPSYYTDDSYYRINTGDDTFEDVSADYSKKFYYMLTDEEKKTFNYIYNTKGNEEAQKFLDDMEELLSRRANKQFQSEIEEIADKGFWGNVEATAIRGVASSVGNVTSGAQLFDAMTNGGNYNPYGYGGTMKNIGDYAQEAVSSNIAEATPNLSVGGVNVPSFLYDTGLSTADSAVGGAIFGSNYSYFMGLGAFQTTARQLADEGASAEDIWVQASVSGIAEVVTEHLSLDQLEKLIKDTDISSWKKFAFNVLRQMGYEGSEEVASDVINHVADELYNGGASEMSQKIKTYMQMGYTEEEAKKKASEEFAVQVASSFIGGAISGGVMGGMASGVNLAYNAETGRQLRANNNLEYIDSASQALSEDSQAKKNYLAMLNGKESANQLTNAQIGSAYGQISTELGTKLNESSVNDIALILQMNGVDEATAKEGAVAIKQILTTNKGTRGLTKAQIKALANEKVETVINSIRDGEITIGESATTQQINQGIDDINRVTMKRTMLQNATNTTLGNESTVIENNDGTTHVIQNENLSSNEQKVVKNAEGLTDTAKALYLQMYNGNVSAELYDDAFRQVYESGVQGGNMDVFDNGQFRYVLGNNVAKIYLEGQKAVMNMAQDATASVADMVKDLKAENFKSGKFESSVDYKKLSSEKRVLYKMAEALSGMGINVKVIDDVRAKSKNGEFDPGDNSVMFNLSARQGYWIKRGEGSKYVVSTMSHELTHWLKKNSPEAYNVLHDVIKNAMLNKQTKTGNAWDDAFNKRLEQAKKHGKEGIQAENEADDEVIARACEDILNDNKAMADMLAQGDVKELSEVKKAIKKFFDTFRAMIKKLLNGFNSNSMEAQYVREIDGLLADMQKAWNNAFTVAIGNAQARMATETHETEVLNNVGVEVQDGFAYVNEVRDNDKTWNESIYKQNRAEAIQILMNATGRSKKAVSKWLDDVNTISAMYTGNPLLQYESDYNKSAWVSNPEYGGSLDYSFLCPKRLVYTGTTNKIMKLHPNKIFTTDDFLTLRNILIEDKNEAPCSYCFVESARARFGKYNKEFINKAKEMNLEYVPTAEDLSNPDMLEKMQREHPETFEQYRKYMNSLSQRKPKMLEKRRAYDGKIIREAFKNDATIEEKNRHGGIRFNSFSDQEVVHILDNMQAVLDMSTVGLSGFGYTKQRIFAKAFGNTNLKINLSCSAKGVDENGRIIFDDVEGMNHEEAIALRNEFSKNVGITCIVFTKEQLKSALADDRIDYVLPFHRSQWSKKDYALMGLPSETFDFTRQQNERYTKENGKPGKKVKDGNIPFLDYWDINLNGRQNAQKYLDIINDRGLTPLFESALERVDGKWVLPEGKVGDGYYKVLIEFKLYDNDGNPSPQLPVVPNFNTSVISEILNEYEGGHEEFPVDELAVKKFEKYMNGESRASEKENDSDRYFSAYKYTKYFKFDERLYEKYNNSLAVGIDYDYLKFNDKSIRNKIEELLRSAYANVLDYRALEYFSYDGLIPGNRRKELYDEYKKSSQNPMSYEDWESDIKNRYNEIHGKLNTEFNKTTTEIEKLVKDNMSDAVVISDDKGRVLSDESLKFYADTSPEFRDEKGRLKTYYHGSDNLGFTEFDSSKSDDNTSFFVSDDRYVAKTYTSGGDTVDPYDLPKTRMNTEKELREWAKERGYKVKKKDGWISIYDDEGDEVGTGSDADIAFQEWRERYDWYYDQYNPDAIKGLYEFYIHATKPLVVDAKGSNWDDIEFNGENLTTREISKYGKDNGYDSVVINNVIDIGGYGDYGDHNSSQVVILFDSESIKSIYNQHPTSNKDFRYSEKEDSDYLDAVNRGDMETAQKMVEEEAKKNGYTTHLYHGTDKFGFTKIDVNLSDDKISFFATPSEETAKTYSFDYDVRPIHQESVDYEEAFDKADKEFYDAVYRMTDKLNSESGIQGFFDYGDTFNNFVDLLLSHRTKEGWEDIVADTVTDMLWDVNEDFDDEYYDNFFDDYVKDVITFGIKRSQAMDDWEGGTSRMGLYNLYAKTPESEFMEFDAQGKNWNQMPLGNFENDYNDWAYEKAPKELTNRPRIVKVKTRDVAEYAKAHGFRGAIIRNVKDDGGRGKGISKPDDVYIFFYPESDVKSADPVTYDDYDNVIPLSQRFNDRDVDIRYSEKEQEDDILGQNERLTTENAKLKSDIEGLRKVAEIQKTKISQKNIENAVRSILNKTNAIYSQERLNSEIKDLYEYALSDNFDADTFIGMLDTLSAKLAERTKVDDNGKTIWGREYEASAYYKQFLKNFRATKLRLNEAQKSEAIAKYGKDYRNAFMGKVILSADGTDLATQWSKWSKQYPELFNANATETEMVSGLLDAYSNIKDTITTVTDFVEGEQIRETSQLIYEKLWNILKNGNVNNDEVKALKDAHRTNMSDITESRDKALEGVKGERQKNGEDYYNSVIAKVVQNRDRKINEIKESIKKNKESKKQNEIRRSLIRKIDKGCAKLRDLMNSNNAKKHVIDPLKPVVNDLLNSIDFASQVLLDGTGRATRKDCSIARAMDSVQQIVMKAEKAKAEDGWTYDFPPDMLDDITSIKEGIDKIIEELSEYDQMMISRDEDYKPMVNSQSLQYTNALILQRLDEKDLSRLADIVDAMVNVVNTTNARLGSDNAHSVDYLGQGLESDLNELPKRKYESNWVRNLLTSKQMLPVYFFDHLGESGKEIFSELMDGMDEYAKKVEVIKEFREKTYTTKEARAWAREIHEFDIQEPGEDGKEGKKVHISITGLQLMSLYELSKREQALKHITGKGIRVEGFRKGLKNTTSSENVLLTLSELKRITSDDNLSVRQKEVADKLQEFMATECASWGNDVTLKRFGIKGFTEENYFPIAIDNAYGNADTRELRQSIYALLNMGFTKSLNERANNGIIIGDILTVFSQHTADMAKYNTMALPVLDLIKVYNYKEQTKTDEGNIKETGVKQAMLDALGKDAITYVNNFIKDLNGTMSEGRGLSAFKKLTKAYKTSAVGANIQVALLQPISYWRAIYRMNPKYLFQGLAHPPQIKKCRENCGIAMWKSDGFYEMDISRGLDAIIRNDPSFKDKAIEISMKLAEWGDSHTWGLLYNAVEAEAVDNGYTIGTKACDKYINERFRDIVFHTQVVDSVMTRSDIMRDKNEIVKGLTAFMSEPTVSYNMIADNFIRFGQDYDRAIKKGASKQGAFNEAFKKNGSSFGRAVLAYSICTAIEVLLRASIQMVRQPDDDKEDWEEWRDNVLEQLKSEMNPLLKIPFIKDIWSEIFDNYTSSRNEYQFASNAKYAFKNWGKVITGNGSSVYKATYTTLKAISQFSGLPLATPFRDVIAMWNATVGKMYPEYYIE